MQQAQTIAKETNNNTNQITLTQSKALTDTAIKSAGRFALEVTAAALAAVRHCEANDNDVSGVEYLYNQLGTTGKIVGPRRQAMFASWLNAFTPIRVNTKDRKLTCVKKKSKHYTGYDFDGLESVSFLDFEAEGKVAFKTNEKIAKSIHRALTKEYTEEQWQGDKFSVETIMSLVKEMMEAEG